MDTGTPVAEVQQTTTYVNGEQRFTTTLVVKNVSADPIAYKALAAADFYFEGSDVGTGVFTEGPPRFIGGTNADTGRSGGFVEAAGPPGLVGLPGTPVRAAPDTEVWGKVQAAAGSATRSFDNTVLGEPSDNAGGVEWDGQTLAAGATATVLADHAQRAPGGAPAQPAQRRLAAERADHVHGDGQGHRGHAVQRQDAALDDHGRQQPQRDVADRRRRQRHGGRPGHVAGADTVIAFVDLNNNGTREAAEPQASALGTFIDNIAPPARSASPATARSAAVRASRW